MAVSLRPVVEAYLHRNPQTEGAGPGAADLAQWSEALRGEWDTALLQVTSRCTAAEERRMRMELEGGRQAVGVGHTDACLDRAAAEVLRAVEILDREMHRAGGRASEDAMKALQRSSSLLSGMAQQGC
jgi:hypothetical protein